MKYRIISDEINKKLDKYFKDKSEQYVKQCEVIRELFDFEFDRIVLCSELIFSIKGEIDKNSLPKHLKMNDDGYITLRKNTKEGKRLHSLWKTYNFQDFSFLTMIDTCFGSEVYTYGIIKMIFDKYKGERIIKYCQNVNTDYLDKLGCIEKDTEEEEA